MALRHGASHDWPARGRGGSWVWGQWVNPGGASGRALANLSLVGFKTFINPALKAAYETLVKDLPEEQRETAMAQIARQAKRAVARSQGQQQGISV